MSEYFQSGIPTLLDWAGRQPAIHADALETALQFINPPQDLRLLDQVLGNYLALWPRLNAINPKDWSTSDALALKALATALTDQPSELKTLIMPQRRRGDPLAEIMTDAPIYCLLTHTLRLGSSHGVLPPILMTRMEKFQWFQVRVLDAARMLNLRPSQFAGDNPGTPEALATRNHSLARGAERSLRRVCREYKGYSSALLDDFASPESSIAVLVDELEAARHSDDPTNARAGFAGNLYLLLSTVYAGRARRKISARGQKDNQTGPPAPPPAPPAIQEDELVTVVHDTGVDDVVLTDFYSVKEEREVIDAGLAPGDIGRTRTVRTSLTPLDIKAGDSLRDAAIRDREVMAAIASKNQYLPYDFARLSLFELVALDEALQALADGGSDFSPEGVDTPELVAVISLALWTGAPLDSVLCATVAPELAYLSDDWSANQVRLVAYSLQWFPPRLILPGRAPAKEEWIRSGMVHRARPGLALPIAGRLERHLEYLMSAALERDPEPTEQRLFLSSPEALRKQADQFLRYINRTSGVTRLTLGRVNSHLFHSIARYTSDVVDACLITGHSPPGKNSAAYYYAPRTSALEAAYLLLVNTIDLQIQGHALDNGQPPIRPATNRLPGPRVGSANCPTDDFLKTFVREISSEVAQRRKRLDRQPSIATWVSFHNHLAAYCVMMLGYATGLRAVQDPFATLDAFDAKSGFLVVHEKGSDGRAAPRLVWLPEVCVRQFEAYQTHLAELAEALALLGCEFADGLTAATAGARGNLFPKSSGRSRPEKGRRSRTQRQTEPPPFLFLLSENARQWDLPRSAALKPIIGHLYPILPNSNRHYLRTRLRELDVPGEVVDALMGHAAHGQQPFCQFSTLSPLDFRALIEAPISQLMDTLGWKVIREVSAS